MYREKFCTPYKRHNRTSVRSQTSNGPRKNASLIEIIEQKATTLLIASF